MKKKKKRKISITDISRELGISITTISFIINKKAENRISKEVIKKVEDYIEKVGYTPNSSAQTLRTGKTKTIVFMAEDISDPFFSAIAKEMEEIAFQNEYRIIYCSTENKKERAMELLNLFKDRQVDAFIITPPEDFEIEMKRLIVEEQQTVMVFDRHYSNFQHHYVVLKNKACARMAVQEFLNCGKRNVAFIGIESELSPLQERLQGYLEAMQASELSPMVLLLKFDETKTEIGRKKINQFLEKNSRADGILFATNGLAMGGLRVLSCLGTKIPQDISIISFDERDVFELYSPPISVIAQPISDLANELIKGTLEVLEKEPSNKELFQKVLPGKLIRRRSLPAVQIFQP
jgi:LacI family transcriptional regulator